MKIRRLFLNIVILFIYIWASSVLLIFRGPFPALRNFFYGSLTTISYAHILVPPLTLWTVNPPPKWKTMQMQVNVTKTHTSSVKPQNFTKAADSSIQVKTYKGKYFTAQILLIPNPQRVKLAVTNHLGTGGETVSQIAARTHAVAAINAGGFQDKNWQGTGGNPIGTTVQNGKIITFDNQYPTIGFTNKGVLEVGYFTKAQIEADHIAQATSFGPILVKDGQGVIKGDGGWGYAPRTAIGQRADGTVIMVVTDGRMVHGSTNLGASMSDLEKIMLQYGAVNAANLDGGSSSTMVLNGKLINTPTDILGERKVATAFIVIPASEAAK